MIEVTAVLRFNQHSLGDCRYKKISRMLRDPEGRVMLLPTWWQALMRYAAQVLNRHHDDIKDIDWDPVVEGETAEYKRYYAPGKFTTHEAFFPGDSITVNAVIPTTITIAAFQELLQVAGRYRGISPFRKDGSQGTFDVISVERKLRRKPEVKV